MTTATCSSWRLLRLAPRMEWRVKDHLAQCGIAHCLPMETYRPAGHPRTRQRPLFPGYVFAELPTDQALDAARAFRGVREIKCSDGFPIAIDPMLVGALVLMEAWHVFDLTWRPPSAQGSKRRGRRPSQRDIRWEKGQRVRIREGAAAGGFAGFVGEVLRTDREQRITLILDLFGRPTPVEVDERALEAAA